PLARHPRPAEEPLLDHADETAVEDHARVEDDDLTGQRPGGAGLDSEQTEELVALGAAELVTEVGKAQVEHPDHRIGGASRQVIRGKREKGSEDQPEGKADAARQDLRGRNPPKLPLELGHGGGRRSSEYYT